jgi:hypothetical protein
MRAHRDTKSILKNMAGLDENAWPGIIIRYIDGKASEDDVDKVVYGSRPVDIGLRSCQREVIFGELNIITGRGAETAHVYHSVDCPPIALERAVMLAEVDQL